MAYHKDEAAFMEDNGYDIDGTWYPRVTRIVGIKAKPALYHFYAGLGSFKEAEEIKDKSATEGTLVHNAIEALFTSRKPVIPDSIAPAVEAFKEFTEENDISVDPTYVERRVYHTAHRYAGTVDALATIDGKFGVLDIKTSAGIYRDYDLQTAAYFYALKSQLPELTTRWILRVDQTQECKRCGATLRIKGGREKIRTRKKDETCKRDGHEWGDLVGHVELKESPYFQHDIKAFLAAKSLWEWENSYFLRKIGYM